MNAVATFDEEPVVDVLLVTGEGAFAEMYRMKLEMDGYRVTAVRDLDGWTEPFRGWRPDIVMVDLSLGDLGRLGDVQRFRSNHFSADVPLLILATESEADLRDRLPLSATDYVLRVSEPAVFSQAVYPAPSGSVVGA
jgi:two-component system, chemotaxis family, chemotaxis protein CheY